MHISTLRCYMNIRGWLALMFHSGENYIIVEKENVI